MKTSRQSSENKNLNWQAERQQVLQRACVSILTAIRAGKPLGRKIREVARRINGRIFKCDPTRRLRCSPKSLRRFWDAWQRGGTKPAAFKLHFVPRRKHVPAGLLIRFAGFCARTPQRSLASAWRQFRRQQPRPQNLSDFLLRKHFSVAAFYLMQSKLKARNALQSELEQLKIETIAEIRRRPN